AAGDAEQAARLARALAEETLAAVYASPLERALETARVIGLLHHIGPEVVPALREIEQGDGADLQFDEYPPGLQGEPPSSPATVRFPGGESYRELCERVVPALDEIVARHSG